jgi:hypothetical protein
VWPTTAASLFTAGYQIDRQMALNVSIQVLAGSTIASSFTGLLNTGIPRNARSVSGDLSVGSTTTPGLTLTISGSGVAVGTQVCGSTTNGTQVSTFSRLAISTPQTIFYTSASSAGTPTFGIAVSGYEF